MENVMRLSATPEEVEIIRTALSEYCRNLRERERAHRCGYSETTIEACVRRLRVEAVLDGLDTVAAAATCNPSAPIMMPDPRRVTYDVQTGRAA